MATKTAIPAGMIDNAIEYCGEHDVRVYRDYSGRGMYGETCFGLVGHVRQITKVLMALVGEAAANGDDTVPLFEMVDRTRTDDMGRATIVYFPGYEIVGESALEEEDVD